jgi:hypothetical protein
MPFELDIWIRVALEGQLVFHPGQPHVFDVRSVHIRNAVNGHPHACDEDDKLKFSPIDSNKSEKVINMA